MNVKRLDRDKKWGFQFFPYYQTELNTEQFKGLASYIRFTDGDLCYWEFLQKAGKTPVCGKGMKWLQLIPEGKERCITAMIDSNGNPLIYYVDVIEESGFDEDGVATFTDKYLDVVFTVAGDVMVQDRDELDEAFKTGDINESQYKAALEEGDRILEEMTTDIPKTVEWTCRILGEIEALVKNGTLTPMFTKYQKWIKEKNHTL